MIWKRGFEIPLITKRSVKKETETKMEIEPFKYSILATCKMELHENDGSLIHLLVHIHFQLATISQKYKRAFMGGDKQRKMENIENSYRRQFHFL